MRIQILEDAQQDILDGFYFYESQEKGLGDYFLDSIFADIDSLQLYAGIHPWYFGYQRLLSKRSFFRHILYSRRKYSSSLVDSRLSATS